MQAQLNNNRVALTLAALILPVLVLVGCSDNGVEPGPSVQTTQASFNATNYWPSYGEDIKSVGNQVFSVKTQKGEGGGYEVEIRSQDLKADFDGLSSGDNYAYAWSGPSEYALTGDVGTTRDLQETVMLKNERTGQEAEGLVVATAEIMPGGEVAFTVKNVISLP